MSKILLALPKLDDGWLDVSVGESHLVRHALFKVFDDFPIQLIDLTTTRKSEYQSPNGYAPLVKLLEDKHQAPVVITNGAKQGLGAVFSTLQKLGKHTLGMRCPWWALMPPHAETHGLKPVCANDTKYDAYLAVLPNNPDGFMLDPAYAQKLAEYHKDFGIPFIHDGVYYSSQYCPKQRTFPAFGDVQIFSASKSFGLSGLRVGWVVCNNHDYYHPVQEYMEMMTTGLSTASQSIMYRLLMDMDSRKDKKSEFIRECQNKLYIAKSIMRNLPPDVMDVPNNITDVPGMFLFARCHKPEVFEKAKVNVADGELFGVPGFARINLAVPTETLIEVVERVNNVCR
jgi:aspartate/methionine/tyrosine aminotransferase